MSFLQRWALIWFLMGLAWAACGLLYRLFAPLVGAILSDLVERYRRLSDQQHS